MASQSASVLEKLEEVSVSKTSAEDKPLEQKKPAAESPETSSETIPSLPQPKSSESKKKPVGAVSLFGGIDVFASKQTKSLLDGNDDDDSFLSRGSPPPNVKKDEKVKKNTVSLFDNEEEEDESDWNEPIFTPSKPTARNMSKVCTIYTK